MNKIDCDVVVIGAGVIGLAIAVEISKFNHKFIFCDREQIIGSNTSSRNSEVIHSGIYYKDCSLKEKLCLKGKSLLLTYLKQRNIWHRICGKVIFSNKIAGSERLEKLYKNAVNRGIDARFLDDKKMNEISDLEPIATVLDVMDADIFDTHSFLQNLTADVINNDGIISLNTKVVALDRIGEKMHSICVQNKEEFIIKSNFIINAGGNDSLNLLKSNFSKKYKQYENYFVKGHYFSCPRLKGMSKLSLRYPLNWDLACN